MTHVNEEPRVCDFVLRIFAKYEIGFSYQFAMRAICIFSLTSSLYLNSSTAHKNVIDNKTTTTTAGQNQQ